MQYVKMLNTNLESSRLVYGCMRLIEGARNLNHQHSKRIRNIIGTALEAGYNHFDHADIYGSDTSYGACEAEFGNYLKSNQAIRDNIIISSKCGIRNATEQNPKHYDLSKGYILQCVDGSLQRLSTQYLDILLLHRPDYLFNPHEICEAFSVLHQRGKVKYFGVSNFSPSQVELLQGLSPFPIVVNQIEINLHNVNAFVDGTLDQCMRLGISVQAWCPLAVVAYPAWGNTFTEHDVLRIRQELTRQALHYKVEQWIIVLAWLLMHPAGIMPIIGTTNLKRIIASQQATKIEYVQTDWYRLWQARTGKEVE